jgi:hypothetical protein
MTIFRKVVGVFSARWYDHFPQDGRCFFRKAAFVTDHDINMQNRQMK